MFPVAISLKLFMPSTLHFSCLFRLKLKVYKLYANYIQINRSQNKHTNCLGNELAECKYYKKKSKVKKFKTNS